MLLDQTIAGRRCALWVPEGTGPFALSLCCCGSASELLPQLGHSPPNRLIDIRIAPKPTGRSTSPPGPRPPCRAAGPLPTAVCWAARPPFCTGSRGSCCPSLGRGLRWTRRRTASSATRWADCLRCGPSVNAKPSPSAPAFPARCGIQAG